MQLSPESVAVLAIWLWLLSRTCPWFARALSSKRTALNYGRQRGEASDEPLDFNVFLASPQPNALKASSTISTIPDNGVSTC